MELIRGESDKNEFAEKFVDKFVEKSQNVYTKMSECD